MPITFECACGRKFRTADGNAGRSATCPDCRNKMIVPASALVAAPALPPPLPVEDAPAPRNAPYNIQSEEVVPVPAPRRPSALRPAGPRRPLRPQRRLRPSAAVLRPRRRHPQQHRQAAADPQRLDRRRHPGGPGHDGPRRTHHRPRPGGRLPRLHRAVAVHRGHRRPHQGNRGGKNAAHRRAAKGRHAARTGTGSRPRRRPPGRPIDSHRLRGFHGHSRRPRRHHHRSGSAIAGNHPPVSARPLPRRRPLSPRKRRRPWRRPRTPGRACGSSIPSTARGDSPKRTANSP